MDEKLLYEVEPELEVPITEEMVTYSRERTGKHIARVISFGEQLGFDFSQHDHTKFSPELNDAYILIDNSYRKDLDPPIPYTEEMAAASFAHIKAEPHHPEYWDDTVVMNSDVDRDDPDVVSTVDATEMSVPAIAEMVCDWCAMSEEVGGHPGEWAERNIGSRWTFTDEQEELIFLLIRMLWSAREDVELETKQLVEEAQNKRIVDAQSNSYSDGLVVQL